MEPETKVRHRLYCTLGILNQILASSVEADAQTPYGRPPDCPIYLALVPTNMPAKCRGGKAGGIAGPWGASVPDRRGGAGSVLKVLHGLFESWAPVQ